MKNRRLILAIALILSFTMMFGSFSAFAAEETTIPSTEETTIPSTEGTYDEGYDDGYDDGYNDGYYNGYDDGYNNGYDNGATSQQKFPSIFDFIKELYWKLQSFVEDIKYRIIDALMLDFPAPDFDDTYLPAGNQKVLGEEALDLCTEFNSLIETTRYVKEEMSVVKTAKVGFDKIDIFGGKLTEALIKPILKEYLVDDSTLISYVEDEIIWSLQDIILCPEGLVSAKKTENADGTADYEFILKEEAAYYGGKDTYGDTIGIINNGGVAELKIDGIYHDLCADTLELEWFTYEFAPLQITGASINYPGATIRATTDAQGRLTSLSVDMPVKGAGEFAIGLIRTDLGLEGYRNEGYTFTYSS